VDRPLECSLHKSSPAIECRVCRHWALVRGETWPDGSTPPAPGGAPPVRHRPCQFLDVDGEAGAAVRVRLNLDHRKHWFPCAKGHGVGGYVATCLDCQTCPDYAPPS